MIEINETYCIEPMSTIDVFGEEFIYEKGKDSNPSLRCVRTGSVGVVDALTLANEIKSGSAFVRPPKMGHEQRLLQHLGIEDYQCLPENVREIVEFRLTCTRALEAVVGKVTTGTRRRKVLSVRSLNSGPIREIVAKIVAKNWHHPIDPDQVRGGSANQIWPLPKGRTVMAWWDIHQSSNRDDRVRRLRLVPRNDLRGNRIARYCISINRIIGEALEKYLNEKKPCLSTIYKDEILAAIRTLNEVRRATGKPLLHEPSISAVRQYFERMMNRDQMMVMRDGRDFAQNTHAASTRDIRALRVGEEVEMDFCKTDVLVQMIEGGRYEKLDRDAPAKAV